MGGKGTLFTNPPFHFLPTELLDTVKGRKLAYYGHTMRKQLRELPVERECKEQCQVHAGEEDHARPGWTTSRRGRDSPLKSQAEWQRTGINGESTSMVWPRTPDEQNPCERGCSIVPQSRYQSCGGSGEERPLSLSSSRPVSAPLLDSPSLDRRQRRAGLVGDLLELALAFNDWHIIHTHAASLLLLHSTHKQRNRGVA